MRGAHPATEERQQRRVSFADDVVGGEGPTNDAKGAQAAAQEGVEQLLSDAQLKLLRQRFFQDI